MKRKSPDLNTIAGLFPTPNTVDVKGGTRKGDGQKQLCHLTGGPMSPTFPEWLMGYPIGWTELNAVGMQWYQGKRGKRSKS